MNSIYSTTIFDIQQDDVDASVEIYGSNDVVRIDVNRFYNPEVGGHLFTADIAEINSVNENANFNAEGAGFRALSRVDEEIIDSVPIYRFFNSKIGGHFFTAVEQEKEHVMTLDNLIFEDIGFRAFAAQSAFNRFRFIGFSMNSLEGISLQLAKLKKKWCRICKT